MRQRLCYFKNGQPVRGYRLTLLIVVLIHRLVMLIVVQKLRYVGEFISESSPWWPCSKYMDTMSGIMVIDIRHILLCNRFWGCWNVMQLFSHSPPLPSKRSFRSQPNYKSLFGVASPDILSYGGSPTDRLLRSKNTCYLEYLPSHCCLQSVQSQIKPAFFSVLVIMLCFTTAFSLFIWVGGGYSNFPFSHCYKLSVFLI